MSSQIEAIQENEHQLNTFKTDVNVLFYNTQKQKTDFKKKNGIIAKGLISILFHFILFIYLLFFGCKTKIT